MAATLHDVVSANLVLVGVGLLNDPAKVEQFRSALDSDMRIEVGLATNVQSGAAEPSLTLTLNRERVVLTLSSARSTIAKEYPSIEDFARLAEITQQAIRFTGDANTPRAFGYNIEMVFDQDTGQPASRYIAERLFDYGHLGKNGWELSGGRGQLIFRDDDGQWTITVEPRFGDEATSRLFLSLNLHKDEQRMPLGEEIKVALEQILQESQDFLNRLDRCGTP